MTNAGVAEGEGSRRLADQKYAGIQTISRRTKIWYNLLEIGIVLKNGNVFPAGKKDENSGSNERRR